jgi:hypothetical protein
MPNDVVMLSAIYSECCNAVYRYAECYYLEFITLNTNMLIVFWLSAVWAYCLGAI